MVQTLDRMFAESSKNARQVAIRALMNTSMTRRNVRDHCLKMMGHISIAEVMGSLNVVEACLVENNDKWIIDLRAINHVCYSLEWCKQSRPFSKGQRSLKLGNREYIFVMEVGLVELCFKTLHLSDCLFVPNFKRNLVSVSCLVEHGLTMHCDFSILIKSNNSFILSRSFTT